MRSSSSVSVSGECAGFVVMRSHSGIWTERKNASLLQSVSRNQQCKRCPESCSARRSLRPKSTSTSNKYNQLLTVLADHILNMMSACLTAGCAHGGSERPTQSWVELRRRQGRSYSSVTWAVLLYAPEADSGSKVWSSGVGGAIAGGVSPLEEIAQSGSTVSFTMDIRPPDAVRLLFECDERATSPGRRHCFGAVGI